jgi:hypothetical protein
MDCKIKRSEECIRVFVAHHKLTELPVVRYLRVVWEDPERRIDRRKLASRAAQFEVGNHRLKLARWHKCHVPKKIDHDSSICALAYRPHVGLGGICTCDARDRDDALREAIADCTRAACRRNAAARARHHETPIRK